MRSKQSCSPQLKHGPHFIQLQIPFFCCVSLCGLFKMEMSSVFYLKNEKWPLHRLFYELFSAESKGEELAVALRRPRVKHVFNCHKKVGCENCEMLQTFTFLCETDFFSLKSPFFILSRSFKFKQDSCSDRTVLLCVLSEKDDLMICVHILLLELYIYGPDCISTLPLF